MAAKEHGKGTRRSTPPTPGATPAEPAPQDEQTSPRRRSSRRAGSATEPIGRTTPEAEAPLGTAPVETTPTARRGRRRTTRTSEAAPAPAPETPVTPAGAPATTAPEAGAETAGDLELATSAADERDDSGAAEGGIGLAGAEGEGAATPYRPRRERHRGRSNALGALIERQFADPASPCRSYSDLERHSGISREALSRYVTARPDRRRSPTIDTLVAIADAMHLSLESVSRAAAASVKGVTPPPEEQQQSRQEVLGTLVAALTPEQFSAVVELLRQLRPLSQPT